MATFLSISHDCEDFCRNGLFTRCRSFMCDLIFIPLLCLFNLLGSPQTFLFHLNLLRSVSLYLTSWVGTLLNTFSHKYSLGQLNPHRERKKCWLFVMPMTSSVLQREWSSLWRSLLDDWYFQKWILLLRNLSSSVFWPLLACAVSSSLSASDQINPVIFRDKCGMQS